MIFESDVFGFRLKVVLKIMFDPKRAEQRNSLRYWYNDVYCVPVEKLSTKLQAILNESTPMYV